MSERLSLTDFAQQEQATKHRGKPCWVCSIPECKELNEAKRNGGIGPQAMVEWLVNECGYSRVDATPGKLANHFNSGKHHER